MAGTIPNLRWPGATLTWDELRSSDVIVPLPARARGALPPLPVDSASVRQDDPLSRCLHAGVLTGGRLNAALGWCDGALATRLRVPGRGSSYDTSAPSRAQAAVIAHLRQPLWSPEDGLPCDQNGDVAAAAAGASPASRAARSHRTGRLPPSSLASAGITAVRMAYGTAAEAAGVATIAAAAAATSRVAEVGMLRVDAETLTHLAGPDAASRLPPLAASPDAVLMHSAPVAVVDAGLRGERVETGGDDAPSTPPWREPLEIKSVCPFTSDARSGRAGHRRRGGLNAYRLSGRGPRDACPAAVIPQAMLQAAAAGAPSTIIASCAVVGTRVWRLPRDDAFLRAMLVDVLTPWHAAHVLNDTPLPPRGGHVAAAATAALAARAVALAAGAVEVGVVKPWREADPGAAFLS